MADPVRPVLLQAPQTNQKWVNADGTPTPYFHRYTHAVFMRGGGYNDDVWRSLGVGYTGLTQINQVSQRIDGVEAALAATAGAVAGLRGDPRLEDAVAALELAAVALVQVQARASGESDRRIEGIERLVSSLGARTTKAQQALQFQVEETQNEATQYQKVQAGYAQRIGASQVEIRDDVDRIDDTLETRAKAALSGVSPINYNSTTGAIGVTLDTDGALAANSDTKIASQKAVKTYAQPASTVLTFLATASSNTAAAVKTLLALVKGDVGLGNVDNTSDANKPVSTAQQTALDLKLTKATPIEVDVPSGSAVSLTTGTAADVGFIDLTVGTWIVTGNVSFYPGATTDMSILRAWISTTSATQPSPPNGAAFQQLVLAFSTGSGQSLSAGSIIVVVASGTTRVYLGTRCTFATSTLTAGGHLIATRVA